MCVHKGCVCVHNEWAQRVCSTDLSSFASSSDVALHAAQRVPGDSRSRATFNSLAQCEVVCAWDDAEVHSTKGQVASRAPQGHPQGGVGKCQEACSGIGGCHICHDCQWHRRDVFRGDIAEALAKGEATYLTAQFIDRRLRWSS